MPTIGLLTYHYSNNYGGIFQCYALYSYLTSLGHEVEIINYIPSYVKLESIYYATGLKKNIFKIDKDDIFPISKLFKRILIKKKYNHIIIKKFDTFRNDYCKLSKKVNEKTIQTIINNYKIIIVGSDQVWSPGERNKKAYFLDFNFTGNKISYAADSTISKVEEKSISNLSNLLNNFNSISVRNEHSQIFVKNLIHKVPPIVADPTLLWDFIGNNNLNKLLINCDEKYILVYVLGKEIKGTNIKVIEKIKEFYGNIKVYSIIIPTMKFHICNYADKILYDCGPIEWLNMFINATFILTDSFHGTLLSLKFKKPFITYYVEKLRATRFKDLEHNYDLSNFIIQDLNDIDIKKSLTTKPDFERINKIINLQIKDSIKFLHKSLNT